MTGHPKPQYRTDDIRRTIGRLSALPTVRVVLAAAIVASSLALLLLSFGLDARAAAVARSVVTLCTAIFTLEICLGMIAQRVGFFGNRGNVAVFLITGVALFTPFDAILMLRLFPLFRNGVFGRRPPRALALAMVPVWLVAFIAAAARDAVLLTGSTCTGWADCIDQAVILALP